MADTEQLGGPWLESRTERAVSLFLPSPHLLNSPLIIEADPKIRVRHPQVWRHAIHWNINRIAAIGHSDARQERQSQFTREETSEYSGRNSLSPLFRIVSHVCLHRWDLHGNPIAGPLLLRPSSLGRAQAGRRAASGAVGDLLNQVFSSEGCLRLSGTHPGA